MKERELAPVEEKKEARTKGFGAEERIGCGGEERLRTVKKKSVRWFSTWAAAVNNSRN
jgi:hypothetical protein